MAPQRLLAARAIVAQHPNRRPVQRLTLERDRVAREVWREWQERLEGVRRYLRTRSDAAVLLVAALSALPWEWL